MQLMTGIIVRAIFFSSSENKVQFVKFIVILFLFLKLIKRSFYVEQNSQFFLRLQTIKCTLFWRGLKHILVSEPNCLGLVVVVF